MRVTLDEANKMAVPKKVYDGIGNVFFRAKRDFAIEAL